MKKLSILFISFLTCILNSCDTNNDFLSKEIQTKSSENYSFLINVYSDNNDCKTRSISMKTEWAVGDIINLYIDGKSDSKCTISYKGNGIWEVDSNLSSFLFSNNSGNITAIYNEKEDTGNNTTSGDILYTEEGVYEKKGNVICISINMNKRPLSRIIIEGISSNKDYIEDFIWFKSIYSIKPMEWTKVEGNAFPCEYDASTNTAVFYGLLVSNQGTTTITLRNEKGYIYKRTYDKVCSPGESIHIEGPLKSPEKWTKDVLVQGITLDQNNLNLVIGDIYTLNAQLKNTNATNNNIIWSSSDNSVVEVDGDGNVMAKGNGSANISAEAADGSATATCSIRVANIEDFITIGYNSTSFSNSGGISISFSMPIYNNYSKSAIIVDNHFTFSSNNMAVFSSLSSFVASLQTNSQPCEILPNSSVNCNVSVFISGYWSYSTGSYSGSQNYITLYLKKDGVGFTKIKYLPWELY